MPRSLRRLGRIPGVVALTAALALTGAWTASPHWRSADHPGPRGAEAPVAGVEDLTAPDPVFQPTLDPNGRRVPGATAAHDRSVQPAKPAAKKAAPRYTGRNHLWIPALGISQNIVWFPCWRQKAPGPYTYRWGCAGRNNVYILGHASGVMKPLHDAYAAGRLRVGMLAWYADDRGVVRKYAVEFWRLTLPVGTTEWWIAPQPVPSLTLQTCYGRDSQWRLKVRLVAVE